jgi:hypothetical protein
LRVHVLVGLELLTLFAEDLELEFNQLEETLRCSLALALELFFLDQVVLVDRQMDFGHEVAHTAADFVSLELDLFQEIVGHFFTCLTRPSVEEVD